MTVLDSVSLQAEAGSVVAITGPSGSGKSSLLAVAATLITPDAGRVVIDGRDVSELSRGDRSALRRENIGIIFQQSNLLSALTGREQLMVMDHLGGGAGAAPDGKADDLLAAVGLSEHAHKRPHQLSGGQRQRVNIARAFMHDPAVLVVDEPTSALDQQSGAAIIDLILRMTRERGAATLLVTHDLRHLDQMDDHYVMRDGLLTRAPVHHPPSIVDRTPAVA